jgi:uncharacterized protein YijF (DUF1287 family)
MRECVWRLAVLATHLEVLCQLLRIGQVLHNVGESRREEGSVLTKNWVVFESSLRDLLLEIVVSVARP